MVHKNPAALIEPPHQRVISAATPVTSPSTTFSQLLNMESAESSPERQTAQQSHEELLQAFQSFKPARRGPSKTPQPLSTSRPQRSSTPATNTSQTTRAGITAFQQDSLSTAASTQDTTTTTTRKRARRASYMEQTGENESSDSDAPLSQALKRPRQSPSEASVQPTDVSSTKQASTVPKHVVEVQIHNRLAHLEKVASRTLKYIDSTIQEEQGRASITPEVAATSTEGIQGQSMDGALQGQNPATIFAPQTTQSSINFATQLLNENQKFAESLSQTNGAFLRSVPPTAISYLEDKLAQATAEFTRLHQQKVDAIRMDYVTQLQKDMDERQKIIDMLLQK